MISSLLSTSQELQRQLAKKRIFIAGGTGFFGRSILDFLIEFPIPEISVTILARNPVQFLNDYPHYKNLQWLNFVPGDVRTFSLADSKYDDILHLATTAAATTHLAQPLETMNVILNGSQKVFELAAQCEARRVLFASSGATYGRQPTEISHIPESFTGAPMTSATESGYGEAKRMAEWMGCEFSRKYGYDFKIARGFAFVGPHIDTNGPFAIGNFIRDAIHGNEIRVGGDGTPLRSYLYSEDLAIWLLKILTDGKSREAYNVGSDQEISILDLAKRIADLLNQSVKISVAKQNVSRQPAQRYIPSIEKARNELALQPWTSLNDAILKTAKFKGWTNEQV